MPFPIPSRGKLVRQLKDYVRSAMPALDTTKKIPRLIGGLIVALASALHDWYVKLQRYVEKDAFWQSCSEKYLIDERAWWHIRTDLTRHPETPASGAVVISGAVGTVLVKGAIMTLGGRNYRTLSSAIISRQTLAVGSLTANGLITILETGEPHLLASGLEILIAGAVPAGLNGLHKITVTAANELTFETDISLNAPATGTITLLVESANVAVMSDGLGQDQNIDSGVQLVLATPPAGLNNIATVDFATVSGGSDLEDVEVFRGRIGEALSYRKGLATDIELVSIAKNVPGVTRAWCRNARQTPQAGWPLPGQGKLAFMRDNDANPYPSEIEIQAVWKALVSDPATKILPAHVVAKNLIVIAPVKMTVDFSFTSIVPDNADMRLAIKASLKQYFAEETLWGADYPPEPDATLYQRGYNCAIMAAITPSGQRLKSFTLASPAGDMVKQPDELLELGDVSF